VTVALFLIALAMLGAEAASSPFEADEADYVATSRYFGYLFLQGDPSRPEWDSNHWTRTQPPLTRYIVGAWLTLRGYDLETLNQPYVSTASSFEVNRRKGRVPEDDVLAAARQPMVLLGAGAIALLYPLGVLIAGMGGGVVAVGLALTSTFLSYTLVHAWAEAPLAFFLLLSALVSAAGARRVVQGGGSAVWAVSLGLAIGLASTTKLTGLVGLPIVAFVSIVAAIRPVGESATRLRRRLLLGAVIATTTMLAVMIGLNPFLWRGPISGLASMVVQRQQEMADQQEQWPEYAVYGIPAKVWQTAVGSTRLGPWSDVPPLAVPIGLGLGALGLVTGLRRPVADRGDRAAVNMLVGWLAFYVAVIMVGLGLSYPRYFLPSCLLFAPFVGAGGATAIQAVARRVWELAGRGSVREQAAVDVDVSARHEARQV
jgi:hypothetical protein